MPQTHCIGIYHSQLVALGAQMGQDIPSGCPLPRELWDK